MNTWCPQCGYGSQDVATVCRKCGERFVRTGRDVDVAVALLEACKAAANELGVPQPGYPAPVANAAKILSNAIAKASSGAGNVLSPSYEPTAWKCHKGCGWETTHLDERFCASCGRQFDERDKPDSPQNKTLAKVEEKP
jgi:Zn finger protein HypA/HybF involved in hydrogenase expression